MISDYESLANLSKKFSENKSEKLLEEVKQGLEKNIEMFKDLQQLQKMNFELIES